MHCFLGTHSSTAKRKRHPRWSAPKLSSSFATVSTAVWVVCSSGAIAAQVDPNDLQDLAANAKKHGATPVVVHLAPVSLSEMHKNLAGVKSRMAAQAQRLVAELGPSAWEAGRWENGIGQMGLNLTESGIKILQNSGNALRFYPGQSWHQRTAVASHDGRLTEIERQVTAQGFVDVQVTLDADGLEFDFGKDGSLAFRSSDRSTASVVRNAQSLFAKLGSTEAIGKETAVARFQALAGQVGIALNPEFTVRLTRQGSEKLATSKEVRSIKPVGFVDQRPTTVDPEAIDLAEKNGTAEVLITVRTPLNGGSSAQETLNATTRSNKRTLDSVLYEAGVRSKVKEFAVFGAGAGHLTAAELKALRASADPRLLSVELNKPIGTAQLATSTATANFPLAWSAGFRGAGQNVIIVDSGVQSNHRFFQGTNGASKVFYEACFGSNTTVGSTRYQSNCPSQNKDTGDSPLGLVGSAAPVLNCSSSNPNACHHGTHVAGIAAGLNSSTFPAGFQGVAHHANIVAIQVNSFDASRVAQPTVFAVDLVAAMQAIASAMTAGTTANPFTVNLSLGSNRYAQSCPGVSTAFTTAVDTLFRLGVPVVAATGNDGDRQQIAFPACVPQVVKVGSLVNNLGGTTIAAFTNSANPANFPDAPFWMAPGGGEGTSVLSAVNGTWSLNGWTQTTAGFAGTSMAAPHVAGLYALIKAAVPGITVTDASNWIRGCGSQALPAPAESFRRIRLVCL